MNKDEEREYQHKKPKTKTFKERMEEEGRFSSIKRTKGIARKPSSKKPKFSSLRRVSKKREKAIQEYNKSEPLNGKLSCASCGRADFLERHHPYGRGGENITKWIYLCSDLGCGMHQWIHTHPNTAFEFGWLQPEIRGLDPANFPDHPKPWEKK